MYKQVVIKKLNKETYALCWTDLDVRKGQKVTVEEEPEVWVVVEVYNKVKKEKINRKEWKVGGLA